MNEINAIEISSITKTYPGGTVGIKDLTLSIKKGEIFGFLGQNGSGKTTTIRTILNILIADKGEIRVFGELVSRSTPEIRESIGYLPGELNIPSNYTVDEFIQYMASLKNKPSNRLQEIADRFELPMEKRVNALSKGNKQKMGIVLAFMHDPDIYILDEPSSGLDPLWQQELYDLIQEERSRGKTIFFSSHNLDEVQRICDRVAIIRDGELVAVEIVSELSKKIRRELKVKIDALNGDELKQIEKEMDVRSSNIGTGELAISIDKPAELAVVLQYLQQYNDRLMDLVFPPASLEALFIEKYRGN